VIVGAAFALIGIAVLLLSSYVDCKGEGDCGYGWFTVGMAALAVAHWDFAMHGKPELRFLSMILAVGFVLATLVYGVLALKYRWKTLRRGAPRQNG
jgi:hypothetical protein